MRRPRSTLRARVSTSFWWSGVRPWRRSLPPASTGAFRLQFDNEEEYRLIKRSVELFLNFDDETSQSRFDLGVRQQGYLWVATRTDTAERQARLVERQRSWGLHDVELIDGDEARRRWPYLAPNALQVRFRGGDGFLDPRALTFGLAAGSTASVVLDCEAVAFMRDGERVTGVRTTKGDISAPYVTVAAGPFSGVVAEQVGLRLPLMTVARHKVVMPEVPVVPPDAPMTIDEETGAHWRPALSGAFPPLHGPGHPTEPADRRRATRSSPRVPIAASRQPRLGCARRAVLEGHMGARRRSLADPLGAVHDDPRLPASDRRHAPIGAVPQHRLQRARDHGGSGRQPPPRRSAHRQE